MPRQGQKRELDKGLRSVVADNVQRLMQGKIDSATALAKEAGVGRRTVDRLLDCNTAANLDTLQAVAAALNVQPWELVAGGEARSVLSRVFAPPVPDSRLGPAWTRPDRRKPLLQGGASIELRTKRKTPEYSADARAKVKAKR
jgi:DNA-binding Xre family transcriptional regulator